MKRRIIILCILFIGFLNIPNKKQEERALKEENQKLIERYEEEEKKQEKELQEDYIGVLEIPKINLKQGFFSFENKRNTVNEGLEVINKDCLPYENCPFIIASHSGSAFISYFKKLEKLTKKDKAYLYYNKKKKEYLLEEIIYQKKNGSIHIKKEKESTLVLTTCNKSKDDIQNIYIFK